MDHLFSHNGPGVRSLVLLLALVALGVRGGEAREALAATPDVDRGIAARQGASTVAALDDTWHERMEAALRLAEYNATPSALGLQAPNRAHNLRTRFGPTGVQLFSRVDSTSGALLGLRLAAVQRGDTRRPVGPGEVRAERNRVEIARPGLREWFVNSSAGLEHGVTLTTRPPGKGALLLEFDVETARARIGDGDVRFETPAGRSLGYDKLVVLDADGRRVAASLAVPAPDRLQIRVEDSGARYPLEVDPIISSVTVFEPAAFLTTDNWGATLAADGDLDGDGFKDLVIGAPAQFTTEGPGAIHVYYGSAAGFASNLSELDADAVIEGTNDTEAFGWAVAYAGDLNGDGLDDLAVGAPGALIGGIPIGAVYIYFGSMARLPTLGNSAASADAEITLSATPAGANVDHAQFGIDLDGAGDVNGDGYEDLIIGAPSIQTTTTGPGPVTTQSGAAFLVLGSGTIASASTLSLDSDPLIVSAPGESELGRRVLGAGDLDADGFADVAVADPGFDNGENNEGGVFVFHGAASGIPAFATPDSVIESNDVGAQFGDRLIGGSDLDGDGYSEIVVPSRLYGVAGGAAFVFAGGPTGLPANANPLDASTQLDNFGAVDFLAWDEAMVDDFTGDGFADLLFGFDDGTSPFPRAGSLSWYGRDGGIPSGDFSTASQATLTQLSAFLLGLSVVGGDTNGDGLAELAFSFHHAAVLHLANFQTNGIGSSSNGAIGTLEQAQATLEGSQPFAEFGYRVADAGDVNGDGFGDAIVGAFRYDAGENDEGAAFVFLGSPTGLPDADPSTAHAMIQSNQISAVMGDSVSSAGDVNGDGFGDVMVAARSYDAGQSNEGAVFVFHGSPTGLVPLGDPTNADAMIEGDQLSASIGFALAGGGDVNGDGYSDLLIGAHGYDVDVLNEGAVFVFHGGPEPLGHRSAATADLTLTGNQEQGLFGQGVDHAGDVNGDGYGDVIVGATRQDEGDLDEGAAYIFHGSASGLVGSDPTTAATVLDSNQTDSFFGLAVAGLGDSNGDGFDDVLVGAYRYDDGQTDEGAVFEFSGSPTGVPSAAATAATSIQQIDEAEAWFGFAVDGAGDLDADGFADAVVGARQSSDGENHEGGIWIYTGTPSGLDIDLFQHVSGVVHSDEVSAGLGFSVAGAGDLNGDGFGDVLAGARTFATSTIGGTAYSFLGNRGLPGRVLRLRQIRGDGSGRLVQPGGLSQDASGFSVALEASHLHGRGLVKAEIEACPNGTPFGDPTCTTHTTPTWTDTGTTGVTLNERVGGLSHGTLYRWRARILRERSSVTQPGIVAHPVPDHGLWKRLQGGRPGGDIRVPEPGFGLGLAGAGVALAGMAGFRRRRRSTEAYAGAPIGGRAPLRIHLARLFMGVALLAVLVASMPASAQVTGLVIDGAPAHDTVEVDATAFFTATCDGDLGPAAVPIADPFGTVVLVLALVALAAFLLGRPRIAAGMLLLAAFGSADLPPPVQAQATSCLDILEWEATLDDEHFVGFGGSFDFIPTVAGSYRVVVRVPGLGGVPLFEQVRTLHVCEANTVCEPERLLIPIGRDENNFHIDQMLYLGAGVADFAFELGFSSSMPDEAMEPKSWPDGVSVEIFDANDLLVARYTRADLLPNESDPVVTPRIVGDRARIVVSSEGQSLYLIGANHLVLRRVDWTPAPASDVSFDDALQLFPGVESIAYLARPGTGSHAYYADLALMATHSIYMSPSHHDAPMNAIGAQLDWTALGPQTQLPLSWSGTASPLSGDAGIYEELVAGGPGQERLFLRADGDRSGFYRITVQRPRLFVGDESDPLVVEMDGLMDGDMAPNLPAARVYAFASAHREQIDAYLADDADYNRRVVEALTILSARLLGSTEGYARLRRTDFYHSFDEFRDVDISFDSDCGRASAHLHSRIGAIAAIQMYREAVNDPFDGGATLMHEWGHYSFSIFDEYVEKPGGSDHIDGNSLMGTHFGASEFCTDLNHDDEDDGDTIGTDSSWQNVANVLGAGPPRPPTSPVEYPQNAGLYLDVLHKLESLHTIVEFENPVPTGQPVNGLCSSVGEPCVDHGDCSSRDLCDVQVGLCVPADGTGFDADFCTHDSQCESNHCGDIDRCELPPLLGQYCGDGRICRDGRRCDSGPTSNGTNHCIPDDGEGEPGDYCSHDAHCVIGHACLLEADVVSSQCLPPGDLGFVCSQNSLCLSGACDVANRVCVPPNGTGVTDDYCTDDAQCASNDCLGNACRPFAAIGEICSTGRICAAGRRCDSGIGSQNTGRCIPNDGQGQVGDFCSHNAHCASGDSCRLDPGVNFGTCEAPSALGGECSDNPGCLSGACDVALRVCVPLNGSGTTGQYCTQDAHCASNDCLSNACRSFAPIGAICSNGRVCAGGRRCDSGPGSQNTGRCIPDDGEGQIGQFCSHNAHCMFPDSCRLDVGQNSGTCESRSGLGGECSDSAGCLSGACDVGARSCVPLNGTGTTGQYCTQDAHCASNDCLSNACRSFAPIGAICSNGRVCSGGRRCDTGPGSQNTGRCIPNDGQGTPGQYCSHNNHCLAGDFCDLASGSNSGTCSEPLALGTPCDGNHECQSGACDPAADRCVPINGTGGTGDYCTQSAHCASNACQSNSCLPFAGIGDFCNTGRLCAGGRRCDQGFGTQNTGRCIPNDGQGTPGQFCSHNNQCLPGHPCNLLPGQNWGSCG